MQNPYDLYTKSQQQAPAKKKAKKPAAKPRRRPAPKRKAKKSASKPIPMTGLTLSFLGLCLSFYIFAYTDDFMSLVSRIEVGFTPSMAESEANSSGQSAEKQEKAAPLPVGKVSELKSDADHLTMKNANIYKALRDKRRELEKKERRLAQLEEELQNQKVEIERQLKEMQEMRRNISSKLDKKVTADKESVDKLVGVYSNMKPQNAAVILSQINEELAVKVLGKMKKQNAAEILNYLEPQKAQDLSEKFTGIKK